MTQTTRYFFTVSLVIFFLQMLCGGCNDEKKKANNDDIRSIIPGFVKDSIYLSPDNSFSLAKAKLGRYFFYDRRMSVNLSKSCSSCHNPNFSFTDGYRRSIGALGDNVQHNAPALINIVFNKYLTAADSSLHFPEQQVNNPMFHNKPVELGWTGNEKMIIARFKKDSLYKMQLRLLFPESEDPFTLKNIQDCITSFIKTIISFNAPYDKYVYNKDRAALSASAKNGMKLFFSDKLHCSTCHGGINFSVPLLKDRNGNNDYYQNTGLYNLDGKGAYPVNDAGLFEITHSASDMGKYKIPGLRNLAFTAPYLHDGSAADLSVIIDIYKKGGRNISKGINTGDGRKNPYKNSLLRGFDINENEKNDLINFLLSLSDSSVCRNPRYSNPFTDDETQR